MRPITRAFVVSFLLVLAVAALAVAGPGQAAPPPPAAGDVLVIMKTSLGDVTIKLHKAEAPVSVANFMAYVNKKFYDGTIFHRVIPTFMVQGGGYTADMTKKPTAAPIKNEAQNGLKNTRGSVALARTADPNSAAAQFFINVKDNPGLDYPKPDGAGYAVFGQVVSGMDVVDKIKDVSTGIKAGMKDVPNEPVIIHSIRLASK